MTRVSLSRNADVLVAGAGPAGLVAGITLARYGITVLVIDKRGELSGLSRALLISTRSMELMRRFGLEEPIRAEAADVKPCAWLTSDLASAEGAELPLGQPSDAEAVMISPTRPAWTPQDRHEPVLLDCLRGMPTATVRFGCMLQDLRQDKDGVQATVTDVESGRVEQLTARYLIAADGAHSTVREWLGIAMTGAGDLADYERVEFSAPVWQVVGERRYALYLITGLGTPGVIAAHGRTGRWSLSREIALDTQGLAELDGAEITGLIRRAAGTSALPLRVERLSTFTFGAQLAERYRAGRCFLAGDAAHRMTPRGGTGMNTAIQDSFDLGWKLAWVLRGWATPSLLDSYERERRPVGAHNVDRSSQPGGAIRGTEDAVRWDLNGRMPHHWLPDQDGKVSTLDLVADGLTLFTTPADPRWPGLTTLVPPGPPIAVRLLDAATAGALGLPAAGALLTRPDGRELQRWVSFDDATAAIDPARMGITPQILHDSRHAVASQYRTAAIPGIP
jgi:putative polyketide hydroxylase